MDFKSALLHELPGLYTQNSALMYRGFEVEVQGWYTTPSDKTVLTPAPAPYHSNVIRISYNQGLEIKEYPTRRASKSWLFDKSRTFMADCLASCPDDFLRFYLASTVAGAVVPKLDSDLSLAYSL